MRTSFILSFILLLNIAAIGQVCPGPPCPLGGNLMCRIHKITDNISWAIKSYMEVKPADYETNPTRKYPLIVYFGGTGEMFQQPGGSDVDLCATVGWSMPWRINVGHFPNEVMFNGQSYSYFVVMPFVTAWEQQYAVDPGPMINYALQRYAGRIDVSRIYLTGMSRGTDNIMNYVTGSLINAKRIAAVVTVANCFPAGGPTFAQQVSNLANSNLHLWGVQCAGDVPCPETNIQAFVNGVNALNPGKAIFSYATLYCDSDPSLHYAWNHAYSPGEFRPPESGNKNIYEWMIQFSQNISLPVVLKDWTARLDNGKVLLQWTTSNEFNTKEFVIQRSTVSGNFENILTVPAAIASSTEKKYSVVDNQPINGQGLYRLVLYDQDGKETIFSIKRVSMPGKWNENVVVPNPVTDGVVSVYMKVDRSQQVSFRLVDLTGRVLHQHTKQVSAGMTQYTANVGTLQKGVYLVQVIGEDFKTSKKISVE